jgi:putative transposase
MNMVRAGVASHPSEWEDSGYCEIMAPPKRYAIIDMAALMGLLGSKTITQLQAARAQWVAAELQAQRRERVEAWSQSLAVGCEAFVQTVQAGLGIRAQHREIVATGENHSLRERAGAYSINDGQ